MRHTWNIEVYSDSVVRIEFGGDEYKIISSGKLYPCDCCDLKHCCGPYGNDGFGQNLYRLCLCIVGRGKHLKKAKKD